MSGALRLCKEVQREGYSSLSSPRPWLEVEAPPNMDGTPAGGEAFAPEDLPRAPEERLPDERFAAFGAALLAAFLAAFFAPPFLPPFLALLRFAVFPAAFFVVLVFFAPFLAPFLAAMCSLLEVIYVTYMVTYVRCQYKKSWPMASRPFR